MSFLKDIKSKKYTLKHTETIIKQPDGRLYLENSDMRKSGEGAKPILDKSITYGYVVDNAPDNVPVEVVSNIYIGSQDCVEDAVLVKYNITCIVSIGVEISIVNLKKLYIPCLDLPETNIIPVLDVAVPYLKEESEKKQNILVHCNAGVSRAAMVIIGYLILSKNYNYLDAYNLVKAHRPCIQPNIGFINQLKALSHTFEQNKILNVEK